MKINLDLISFSLGIIFVIIFGIVIAVIIADKRHRCKFCGRRTNKICKLIGLPDIANHPAGTMLFLSYIFRDCKGGKHVTVSVKTVALTAVQIAYKPGLEFDWNDDRVARLCRMSNVSNPITTLPGKILEDHPIIHGN